MTKPSPKRTNHSDPLSRDHIYVSGAYYGYHQVLQAVRDELPLPRSWSECQNGIVGVVNRCKSIDTIHEQTAREAAPHLDNHQWDLVHRCADTGEWVMLFDKSAARGSPKTLYHGPACMLLGLQPPEPRDIPEDLIAALGPPQEDVLH